MTAARRCRLLFAALIFATGGALAQSSPASADVLSSTPAQVRFGFERVKLPGGEKMGLAGTSYLLEVAPGWWFGPSAYGAITGERGGLFTVGVEGAWRHQLVGPLGIELGYYAGGGGGGSAPVGSGLMLRPHVDLLWQAGEHRFGLSLSQVRFADGQIDSRQLGLVWSFDTDFRHVPSERLGGRVVSHARSGIGFDRVQAVAGVYRPRSGARRVTGAPLPASIGFAGARLEQAFTDTAYWGIEANGAASGGVAGYAEYLATLGTETALWGDQLTVGARVALGMGGGGDVDVGGGLLMKASVYGISRVAGDLGVTFEGGMVNAPQGSFKALYGSVALNWILDDRVSGAVPSRTTRTEWVGGIERYRAARRDGSERDLQAVSLRVNRYIAPNVYLSGQAHSALDGGAGGYSVGLLGLGVRTSLGPRWHAGVEALAGAAGGGGVDTSGGLVMQPMAYAGYELARGLALRAGAGYIKSVRGPLSSPVFELSLAYTFGVASRGYR
ncbi:hypothetical protein [Methylibium sp.]|uniref:hypothetical protein n=1 Tax=Methylibium sp. TaxID=2067992 RepID=UPI003D11AA31